MDIPQGASIASAYLQFQTDETKTQGAVTVTISGEASDSGGQFSGASGDVSSRPRTGAVVQWSPPPWPVVGEAAADQQSPDIAPIIQEIVDRPDWNSGNSLVLIIQQAISSTETRTAESYDGDPAGAPLLSVNYTESSSVNTAPSVTITAPANGSSFDQGTAITFSGSATDNEDDNATLTGTLAWTSDRDGAIGTGGSVSTSALSVGTHLITASVTDSGGLPASATISVTINAPNTAPSVTITAPASGSSFDQGTAITFSGSATDIEDDDATLTGTLAWTSDRDGAIGTGGSVSTSALSVGTHLITASVTDSGGLPASATISVTINAPNTAPSVTITAPANGSSFDQGTAITFSGSATDNEDDDATLTGTLAWTSDRDGAIGTGGSVSTSALSVGTHLITASVTDSGGLPASATISVTINAPNTAPSVTITAPANGSSFDQGTAITFSGSATDIEDDDATLTGTLAWTSDRDGAIGTGGSVSTSALSVGTHLITASVTDSGGLPASATISVTINAPNTAPSVTITAPANGSSFDQGTAITFSGSATDNEDDDATLTGTLAWTSDRDGAIGTGGSVSTSALSVGTHLITASVTDSGGLPASATISVTINAPNTAPSVTITAPANGSSFDQGTAITFSGSATDNEDDNATLTGTLAWTSDRDGAIGTGGSVSTSALSVGTHLITASVTDSGGLPASATISVTINAPNTAPSVTITAPANGSSFDQGTAITFSGSATDNEDDNATLTGTLAWTSDRDGAIGTGGSVSTSALSVGTHLITASVTDSGGLPASATISVTIAVANQPPVANNDTFTLSAKVATVIDVLANDSDPDGDSLSVVSVNQVKRGSVEINSDGTLTYTPNNTFKNNDTFQYTISDGEATATAVVHIRY